MSEYPAAANTDTQQARTSKQLSGERAESLAVAFLLHRGYELVERNFWRRHGEIDLIVRDPDDLSIVFVEVRYRGNRHPVSPLESITTAKQRRIVRTALAWLSTKGLVDCSARIDVMGISLASDTADAAEQVSAEHTTTTQGQMQIVWIRNAIEA